MADFNESMSLTKERIDNLYIEKRPHLAAPGIYAIFCEPTGRAYFFDSENILEQMDYYLEEIIFDLFQGPKDLLNDLKLYPFDSFWFIIFTVGPEWKNIRKSELEVENIKKTWPYGFYYKHGANFL